MLDVGSTRLPSGIVLLYCLEFRLENATMNYLGFFSIIFVQLGQNIMRAGNVWVKWLSCKAGSPWFWGHLLNKCNSVNRCSYQFVYPWIVTTLSLWLRWCFYSEQQDLNLILRSINPLGSTWIMDSLTRYLPLSLFIAIDWQFHCAFTYFWTQM